MRQDVNRCPWCGHALRLVWVHGHGQCGACGTNVDECCRGEVCAPAPARAAPPARDEGGRVPLTRTARRDQN